MSLPPSQPVLTSLPYLSQNIRKEYDMVDKLCNTSAKISLWKLQTSSTYHEALQRSLTTLPTPPLNTDKIHSFFQCMNATPISPKTMFIQDYLPPQEFQDQYDSLMIIIFINGNHIHMTLIDNGFGLNVFSMNILKETKADISTIKPNKIPI